MALPCKPMSASVSVAVTLVFVELSFGSCSSVMFEFLLIPTGFWSLLFRPITSYVVLSSTLVGILNVFVFQQNM